MTTAPRNLVLVARPREPGILADFKQVAGFCRELDPMIHVIAICDSPWSLPIALKTSTRPTLVFSPQRLFFFHALRGTVRSGHLLSKSQEYRRLESIGIPVPPWRMMTPSDTPELADLGRYIVTKPDYGGYGADVRIRRSSRARWSRPKSPAYFTSRTGVIAQKFIYTGRWPISYRVGSLFGRPLWSWRAEASHHRTPLEDLNNFAGVSVLSSHKGCSFVLNNDPEIIALAERAHSAFPEIPMLGADIVREEPSGKLFVLEVNATGDVWPFSSKMGRSVQQWSGIDLAAQFGGFRRAAEILVAETHRQAR
jgi:hypothetical protein